LAIPRPRSTDPAIARAGTELAVSMPTHKEYPIVIHWHRHGLFALALGLVMLAGFARPAAANLLLTPGFETGDLAGWSPSGAASASSSAPFVHDGAFGAFLDGGTTPPGANAGLIQSVALPGAGTYAFGGWLRAFTIGSESGVFDQIQVSNFVSITSEGGVVGASVANFANFQDVSIGALTRASDCVFFSGTFDYSGPAGGTVLFNFNLQNQFSSTVSAAAGDSFFLEQVPEPATLALLGAGLLGLGFSLRRKRARR